MSGSLFSGLYSVFPAKQEVREQICMRVRPEKKTEVSG